MLPCKLTVVFAVTVFVNAKWTSKTERLNDKLCRECVEAKDPGCIATNCKNISQNTTGLFRDSLHSLPPPIIYCQDEGFIAFVWDVLNETSYFLEYSTNEEDRAFTNLTENGFEILTGLQHQTHYIIQLTSLKIIGYNILINRSRRIFLTTLSSGGTPLPVEEVYVDSLNFAAGTYNAVVKWKQASDKSCFYNIVWYGGQYLGSVNYTETEDVLSEHKFNLSDLEFGQNYTFSINAVRGGPDSRTESSEVSLNILVPTCLETFQSLKKCVPEVPENLDVEEFIRENHRVGIPRYDIKMSWKRPNYVPDFYIAVLDNQISEEVLQMNITGDQTSAEYLDVELESFYQVSLQAFSQIGPSPITHMVRAVNTTAALLVTEPLMSIEMILLIVSPFIVIGLILMLVFNQFVVKKTRTTYFKDLDEKKLPKVNYIVPTNLPETDEWELSSEKLIIRDVLGEGAFGVVRKGDYSLENGNSIEVAIKMLKNNPTQDELKQFYQEIDIMKSVPTHPHLVSLIGCMIQDVDRGPLLVVEYCSKGDLQTYLRNAWSKLTNRSEQDKLNLSNSVDLSKYATNKLYDLDMEQEKDIPQPKDLISYARQIALGMEYLSSLKLIHRDLAARNILICSNNTVKISDFGLSRDVYYNRMYCKTTGGKLPFRWMALESMTHQVYTSQSDVWSFGILLWEIVTLGSTPYPGITYRDLLPLLKGGYRMEKPSNCSDELYTIMCNCWKAAPKERPTFSELRKILDELLESMSNYLNLNAKEAADISICRKNNMNKYKHANFSGGYVIQMQDI